MNLVDLIPVFTDPACGPLLPSIQEGDRFWKIPECYIRGNTIKYLRIIDEVSEEGKYLEILSEEESIVCLRVCLKFFQNNNNKIND